MKVNDSDRAVILFSCPDRRGIVAEVSHFVSTYSGNIIHSSQHKDEDEGIFFMRIEWSLTDFAIPKEKIRSAFEPIAIKYEMNWELRFGNERARVAIFVSKFDHCLYELLIRNKEKELPCDIVQIISNHEDAREIADYFKVPFACFPMTAETKAAVEQQEWDLMDEKGVDLIVLARYMQVLSSEFVNRYRNKIINIHHSFLPAFIGAKPYHQAYKRGVKLIGATSHYVTTDLDEGPIIEQDVERISHRDTVQSLISKGKNLEKEVLARAVKNHLEHKVLTYSNKTVVFDY